VAHSSLNHLLIKKTQAHWEPQNVGQWTYVIWWCCEIYVGSSQMERADNE